VDVRLTYAFNDNARPMKILLIGANGQLGSDLQNALARHDVVATARASNEKAFALDVTDAQQVRDMMTKFSPRIVINTSAFHRVDEIERDSSQALHVNALAAHNLALICREFDIPLMHFSSDYVFDGAKRTPYVESDLPNPLSAYGASKLSGELLIRAAWNKHYIVRTCGLYGVAGASGKGGNFVNTMLRLAGESKPIRVVSDQVCTPTFTQDLAIQSAQLIDSGVFGTYHITNEGGCAWNEFADAIFECAGLSVRAKPITSVEFGAPAIRPPYSVLDNLGLKKLGMNRMRHWRDALAEYVRIKIAHDR
jgi:dTDP-4-dehydrorhamnose reductase